MQNDIFGLLMLILLLENGGGTENINQLVILFLLMNSRDRDNNCGCRRRSCDDNCGRDDGFTF